MQQVAWPNILEWPCSGFPALWGQWKNWQSRNSPAKGFHPVHEKHFFCEKLWGAVPAAAEAQFPMKPYLSLMHFLGNFMRPPGPSQNHTRPEGQKAAYAVSAVELPMYSLEGWRQADLYWWDECLLIPHLPGHFTQLGDWFMPLLWAMTRSVSWEHHYLQVFCFSPDNLRWAALVSLKVTRGDMDRQTAWLHKPHFLRKSSGNVCIVYIHTIWFVSVILPWRGCCNYMFHCRASPNLKFLKTLF